jgi:hypothetical protein
MPFSLAVGSSNLVEIFTQMLSSMPSAPSEPLRTRTTPYESTKFELAKTRTVLRGGLIQLYRLFSPKDVETKEKILKLAKEIVEIAHELEAIDEIWWHVPIQVRGF